LWEKSRFRSQVGGKFTILCWFLKMQELETCEVPLSALMAHNFCCFTNLQVSPIKGTFTITGANGSGKTSILWAIVLRLRAYNSQFGNSKGLKPGQDGKLELTCKDLAELLNHSSFRFGSYLGEKALNKCGRSSTIEGNILGRQFSCHFTGNSCIHLGPQPTNQHSSRRSASPSWGSRLSGTAQRTKVRRMRF